MILRFIFETLAGDRSICDAARVIRTLITACSTSRTGCSMKIVVSILLAVVAGRAIAASADAALPATIEFNRDVRPILSDNCFYCHGPDPKHREAKLRLDVRESALKAKAIVPGKIGESEMLVRIMSEDPDDRMPPPDSHKRLTTRQKEILKRWVEQGAPYQQHWAYEPPVKAVVPAGKNGIDVLVQRRLTEVGLSSSPPADRRILIRRLYSDLLGLPPRPDQVDVFEKDHSPGAYGALVEAVLGNPHFGERMAIGWLDVVRYADTIGYHSDNPRNVWPYRDWVIQSFNDNKKFDRFTLEQIAGDLLPDANQETRVGSAFNRLLLSTEEGGAQARDYQQRMLTDRVRAVGAAWLGQTTGCAQCHDHKFDPITQRDFYSLGAFFADIKEPIVGRREDGMTLVSPSQQETRKTLEANLAAAVRQLELVQPLLDVAQIQWEADVIKFNATLTESHGDSKSSAADRNEVKRVLAILQRPTPERTTNELEIVRAYFQSRGTPLYQTERDAVVVAQRAKKVFEESLPKCLVSVSTPEKRTVRILPRGNWMETNGPIVKPAVPHFLPQAGVEGRELTRLDLARWLVSRENPLTARTVMNRLWKQFFGMGLSRVLDDLGAQGEPPANPALLDWLACEFMDSGWDMKHMIKIIVTSETYRQVSTVSSELMAADPYNREFARQGRFRVDAELVRDNALALAGLLSAQIGGPSVKPYQPERYWENLNFPARDYQSDSGESQYRRGLYTWWQRSFLHPSLLAFDAPSREEACAERNRSNIPQQALVLLNDPTYIEASRTFAVRILVECRGTTEQRIAWAWQQALQRNPRADEVKTMANLFNRQFADYRDDPSAADELLKTGQAPLPDGVDRSELAAWTHVSRVLLNLHESITRI